MVAALCAVVLMWYLPDVIEALHDIADALRSGGR